MADPAAKPAAVEEEEEIIREKVLEILRNSNMDETTMYQVRKLASEELGFDLSTPEHKKLVRKIVDNYLSASSTTKEEEEEENNDDQEGKGSKEYDDEGNLIICHLSGKRKVAVTEFKGKTLVSIREYYTKNGKDLPTSKGISLTAEQWASFKNNVPAIEKAINKLESRLKG